MNKKVISTDIIGGPGIQVYKNENTQNIYNNGEYIDLVNSVTNISVNETHIMSVIDRQLQMTGTTTNNHIRQLIQSQVKELLIDLLKKSVQFEIVKWTDDTNKPAFTCMVCFDGQVIAEKDITDGNI